MKEKYRIRIQTCFCMGPIVLYESYNSNLLMFPHLCNLSVLGFFLSVGRLRTRSTSFYVFHFLLLKQSSWTDSEVFTLIFWLLMCEVKQKFGCGQLLCQKIRLYVFQNFIKFHHVVSFRRVPTCPSQTLLTPLLTLSRSHCIQCFTSKQSTSSLMSRPCERFPVIMKAASQLGISSHG